MCLWKMDSVLSSVVCVPEIALCKADLNRVKSCPLATISTLHSSYGLL